MYGGSTGGWEALAAQMFYPDEYNGCWAACPDPIDFRAYTVVDIYEDKNAYWLEGPFGADRRGPAHPQLPRPRQRDARGDRTALELVLGTKSRSGEQWDIWEAVYSPVGRRRLPEADLGQAHGRDRPGGRRVLARSTTTCATSCSATGTRASARSSQGKIHIYVGDMDNYYLNNAVYLSRTS